MSPAIRPRRTAPALAATLALLGVAAAPAAAQAPPASGTVTAGGLGIVRVTPLDRTSNASIAKAVADARAKALPLAVTAARTRAQELATNAGLRLGPLTGISDGGGQPYFYGPFGTEGTFGPGRYCGTVGRYRTQRLENGRIRRTRIGSRRTCRVPSRVAASVTVTFVTAPAA